MKRLNKMDNIIPRPLFKIGDKFLNSIHEVVTITNIKKNLVLYSTNRKNFATTISYINDIILNNRWIPLDPYCEAVQFNGGKYYATKSDDLGNEDFVMEIIYQLPIKNNIYPDKCPHCGAAAYIGLNKIECSNKCSE